MLLGVDGGEWCVLVNLCSGGVVTWEFMCNFKIFSTYEIHSLTPEIVTSTGQTDVKIYNATLYK